MRRPTKRDGNWTAPYRLLPTGSCRAYADHTQPLMWRRMTTPVSSMEGVCHAYTEHMQLPPTPVLLCLRWTVWCEHISSICSTYAEQQPGATLMWTLVRCVVSFWATNPPYVLRTCHAYAISPTAQQLRRHIRNAHPGACMTGLSVACVLHMLIICSG